MYTENVVNRHNNAYAFMPQQNQEVINYTAPSRDTRTKSVGTGTEKNE